MDQATHNLDTLPQVSPNQDILSNSDSVSLNEPPESLEILFQDQSDADVPLPEQRFNTFTCFGKLPIKLWTVIWRFSFPRRRKVYVICPYDSLHPESFVLKSCHRPQLAFWANRESRNVGLKHYCVLLQDIQHPMTKIYFHPSLDTIVFPNLDPLLDGRTLSRASLRLLASFQRIQSLEMHNMWWSSVRDAIIGPQGDDGALHWSGLDVNEERERIVPAYFKCSHELWLINNDEYFRGELESLTFPGNGTKCKKGLEHFFRTKANADPEFKVPKITILKFEDCSESEGSDGGTNNRSNEEEDKEGNEEHDEDGDEGDDEEQDERSDRLSESDASNRVNISDE